MTIHTTPRAADAIIAQMTARAAVQGWFSAMVDGQERDVCAFFSTADSWDGGGATFEPKTWFSVCTLLGAWIEDGDTGEAMFAGNRDECVKLLGEREVARWEETQTEREWETQ